MPNAQDVKAVSLRERPFWQDTISRLATTSSPYFSVKLCYAAQELTQVTDCARFFPFELEAKEAFFEPLDFNFRPYFADGRTLLRLPQNFDPKQFPFLDNGKGGTYLVPLDRLETVSVAEAVVKATRELIEAGPEPSAEEAMPLPEGPDKVDFLADPTSPNLPDAHPNQLTVRDEYALRHSVPVSTQLWINQMIEQGNLYKKQLHQ